MSSSRRVLIYGFGNPGRCDDGLGPALATALEGLGPPGVSVEANYQPVLEDAATIADHDAVLFVDAALAAEAPFELHRVCADASGAGFSTHSVRPAALLALAEALMGRHVMGYLLAIRGYDFNEFREGLSSRAERNLAAALQFVREGLRARNFVAYLDGHVVRSLSSAEADAHAGA